MYREYMPKKAKPNIAARPSAVERKGPGVYPDYDSTQHAHAQVKAKRIRPGLSAAEKGSSGVCPDYGNQTRTHAEEGQAERSGQAERCVKGESGVSPYYDTTKHAHAQKKKKLSLVA
jgi:hypothetical protein